MVLCPTCGNKRCPKATDHRLDCTNSNEPEQYGSIYGETTPDYPEQGRERCPHGRAGGGGDAAE
jgi:hypothetical protein